MHDFEVDEAFLQDVGFVDCEAHGKRACVVVGYFVFFYGGAFGASAVFGGGGGGEVPFYVGGACCEGNVVEVDYLGGLAGIIPRRGEYHTLSTSSNLG